MCFMRFFFLFESLYIIELKVYTFIFKPHSFAEFTTNLSRFIKELKTPFWAIFFHL
jgi:hypothetical protein